MARRQPREPEQCEAASGSAAQLRVLAQARACRVESLGDAGHRRSRAAAPPQLGLPCGGAGQFPCPAPSTASPRAQARSIAGARSRSGRTDPRSAALARGVRSRSLVGASGRHELGAADLAGRSGAPATARARHASTTSTSGQIRRRGRHGSSAGSTVPVAVAIARVDQRTRKRELDVGADAVAARPGARRGGRTSAGEPALHPAGRDRHELARERVAGGCARISASARDEGVGPFGSVDVEHVLSAGRSGCLWGAAVSRVRLTRSTIFRRGRGARSRGIAKRRAHGRFAFPDNGG